MISSRFTLLLLATLIIPHSVAPAEDLSLQRFVNEKGNFEASWPKKPDHSTSSDGKKTTHESKTKVDQVAYVIQAMELPAGLSDEVLKALAKQTIGQMRDELRRKFKDQVTIDRDLMQHGHLAAEFGAPEPKEPEVFSRARIFVAGKMLFLVSAKGPEELTTSSVADVFFDSVRPVPSDAEKMVAQSKPAKANPPEGFELFDRPNQGISCWFPKQPEEQTQDIQGFVAAGKVGNGTVFLIRRAKLSERDQEYVKDLDPEQFREVCEKLAAQNVADEDMEPVILNGMHGAEAFGSSKRKQKFYTRLRVFVTKTEQFNFGVMSEDKNYPMSDEVTKILNSLRITEPKR